jgi:hypothetical protein
MIKYVLGLITGIIVCNVTTNEVRGLIEHLFEVLG